MTPALTVGLRISVTVTVAKMPSACILMKNVNVNATDRTPLAICFPK